MEYQANQRMPDVYMSSDQANKFKRTLGPEKQVMDLKLALDPVLERLGRPPATYNTSDSGEAVVTVHTRMGLQRYMCDHSTSSIESKRWMAVSKALEVILEEEGLEVRDPSHTDLLWTRHAIRDYEVAMGPFNEEVKYLTKRIIRLMNDNDRLKETIVRLNARLPDV